MEKADPLVRERSDLVTWRSKFLRPMQAVRAEGKSLVYVDKTWLNTGHTVSREWIYKDGTVKYGSSIISYGYDMQVLTNIIILILQVQVLR